MCRILPGVPLTRSHNANTALCFVPPRWVSFAGGIFLSSNHPRLAWHLSLRVLPSQQEPSLVLYPLNGTSGAKSVHGPFAKRC